MPLDPLERARRLTPLVVATLALALLLAPAAMRATGAPAPRLWLAPALVALAAALVTQAVAALRGGWSGIIGGAVAGGWLAACPPAHAAAAALGPAALALAATAALLAAAERLARAGDRPVDRGLVAVTLAVVVVAADLRAWPLALVAATLVTRRADPRARWLALAPWLGGIVGALLVLLAAVGHGPAWAAAPAGVGRVRWLADAVDQLGPIALVVGALGLTALGRERAARWPAALVVAALATAVPLATPLGAPALAAWAVVLGVAVAGAATRLGRPSHQALAGATLAVLLAAPFVFS